MNWLAFLILVITTQKTILQNLLGPLFGDSEIYESFVFRENEFVIVDVPMIWSEASLLCRTLMNKIKNVNGSLAVLNTKKKAVFLGKALAESKFRTQAMWVGGSKGKKNGTSGFLWINDKGMYVPDEYFIKRGNETFQHEQNRSCLAFSRQYHNLPLFIDLNCFLKRPVICQKVFAGVKNDTSTNGWFRVGQYAYNIFYSMRTWKQAVNQCREKYKAHLASFRNMEEVTTVARNLLVGRPSLENAWIGGRFVRKKWRFVHNEVIINSTTDPETGFPPWRSNASRILEGCLLLDRHYDKNNVFIETRCERRKSFICSKSLKKDNGTAFETPNMGYIFYDILATWDEAKEICEETESVLVKVVPQNIANIIYMMVENRTETQHIWIGGKLKRQGQSLNFVWLADNSVIPPNNLNMSFYPPWIDDHFSLEAPCLNMDVENHNKPMFYGLNCENRQKFICETSSQQRIVEEMAQPRRMNYFPKTYSYLTFLK